MWELLAKIIPLDLAATLSPGLLAVAILLLGGKFHPKARTFALFLGIAFVGIVISLLGFFLGKNAPDGHEPSVLSAVVDSILGIIFIIFGIKALAGKERKLHPQTEDKGVQWFKWLAIGVIASATNFDALFLNFTAAREVGGASVNDLNKFILLIVNVIFFSLPVLLPLVLYLTTPLAAQRLLSPVNHFVLKYSRYIICVLFLIFGLVLLFRSLSFFF